MKTATKDIDTDILLEKENVDLDELMGMRKAMLLSMKTRGQLEKTFSRADEAKKELSSQAKAIARKGVICWMLDKTEEAIKYLEEGSSTDEATYILGLCYMETGRNEKAHKLLAASYKTYSDSPEVFASYLDSLIKTGQIDEVLQIIQKVKGKFAKSPMLSYYHGLCLEQQGDYDKAEEEYENALDIDSEYAPAIFRLAYRYDLSGKDEDALELYEKLLHIKPTHINALINLGIFYEDNDEPQKALECYEAVLNIHPNHSRANLYKEDARSSLVMYYDDNLKRKEQELKRLLSQPLSEFQLPTRARNGLDELNIKTIGELVRKTEDELLSHENFGAKSLVDIKDLLARRGLMLSAENRPITLESLLKSYISAETPKQVDVVNKPIFEIDWSARVKASLTRLKVYTFGDLANKSEKDFMDLPNFGQTSLDEIRRRLEQFGLSLKSSE
ncbi:MAG: tetratricopeptide repeat protein [Planctomycetes bacterium]|nr:tetratricopeptide repeat protein [Planctomycetota bacterium]